MVGYFTGLVCAKILEKIIPRALGLDRLSFSQGPKETLTLDRISQIDGDVCHDDRSKSQG